MLAGDCVLPTQQREGKIFFARGPQIQLNRA
jgi:hypothetical protein